MRVKDILHRLKANSRTFKYLDDKDRIYFKNSYNYLKNNKDRELSKFSQTLLDDYLVKNDIDYLVKIKAIQFVSTNLI